LASTFLADGGFISFSDFFLSFSFALMSLFLSGDYLTGVVLFLGAGVFFSFKGLFLAGVTSFLNSF
jgi:hypothetical protein